MKHENVEETTKKTHDDVDDDETRKSMHIAHTIKKKLIIWAKEIVDVINISYAVIMHCNIAIKQYHFFYFSWLYNDECHTESIKWL